MQKWACFDKIKRPRTTITPLEKRVENLTEVVDELKKDLASLAGVVERLSKKMVDTTINHRGLEARVS